MKPSSVPQLTETLFSNDSSPPVSAISGSNVTSLRGQYRLYAKVFEEAGLPFGNYNALGSYKIPKKVANISSSSPSEIYVQESLLKPYEINEEKRSYHEKPGAISPLVKSKPCEKESRESGSYIQDTASMSPPAAVRKEMASLIKASPFSVLSKATTGLLKESTAPKSRPRYKFQCEQNGEMYFSEDEEDDHFVSPPSSDVTLNASGESGFNGSNGVEEMDAIDEVPDSPGSGSIICKGAEMETEENADSEKASPQSLCPVSNSSSSGYASNGNGENHVENGSTSTINGVIVTKKESQDTQVLEDDDDDNNDALIVGLSSTELDEFY